MREPAAGPRGLWGGKRGGRGPCMPVPREWKGPGSAVWPRPSPSPLPRSPCPTATMGPLGPASGAERDVHLQGWGAAPGLARQATARHAEPSPAVAAPLPPSAGALPAQPGWPRPVASTQHSAPCLGAAGGRGPIRRLGAGGRDRRRGGNTSGGEGMPAARGTRPAGAGNFLPREGAGGCPLPGSALAPHGTAPAVKG